MDSMVVSSRPIGLRIRDCLIRGLLLVKARQSRAEPLEFRHIVDDDVGLIRVQSKIVLMIRLSRIEGGERNYLSYDWRGESSASSSNQGSDLIFSNDNK